jgi:hypothetical protein
MEGLSYWIYRSSKRLEHNLGRSSWVLRWMRFIYKHLGSGGVSDLFKFIIVFLYCLMEVSKSMWRFLRDPRHSRCTPTWVFHLRSLVVFSLSNHRSRKRLPSQQSLWKGWLQSLCKILGGHQIWKFFWSLYCILNFSLCCSVLDISVDQVDIAQKSLPLQRNLRRTWFARWCSSEGKTFSALSLLFRLQWTRLLWSVPLLPVVTLIPCIILLCLRISWSGRSTA